VSADTHIAFSDFDKMHVNQRSTQRFSHHIPPFAYNDKQLARVLSVATWRWIKGRQPMPEAISFLELRAMSHKRTNKLRAQDVSQFTAKTQAIRDRMYASMDSAGGYMELIARVAYLSWRMGYESPQVAEACYGCSPQQVRIIIYRLKLVARSLGFDAPITASPGSIVKKKRRKQWPEMIEQAQQMRAVGKKAKTIAGVLRCSVQSLRAALYRVGCAS
jgi:hypothetical protein